MVLADIDRDLDLDVVATNIGSDDLSLLANDGQGNLSNSLAVNLPIAPGFLAAGDLDGDGDADLVISHFGEIQVLVLWGSGDGTFAMGPSYDVPPQASRVALADFDDDCDLDIVVSSNNVTTQPVTFSLLLNDGIGVFDAPLQYSLLGTHHAGVMANADVDLDGNLDLVIATWDAASVFRGNNDGSFGVALAYGGGHTVQGIASGDLDGDGDIDLGTANLGDDSFSVLWNRGCAVQPPFNPADLDTDGQVDLQDYASLFLCLNGPGVCQVTQACNPPGLADTDLDGDGDVDLRDAAVFVTAFSP
jgi:hypothetical protein